MDNVKPPTSTILTYVLFIGLLLSVCYYYQYHEIVKWRPQSVHKWRQSDCASLALNYYQHQLDFFKPHTHNLTSDQGKSSACATSEVPILYYTVAKLYQIFGYHDSVFRLFNTLIFLCGIFFLFLLNRLVVKNTFWAGIATFFLFSSPVLVYYGNNYLSDSAALSFSIIAWYFYYRFITMARQGSYLLSVIFFLLAAFCKLTAMISVFALFGYWTILKIRNIDKAEPGVLEKINFKNFITLLLVPILTLCWVVYARIYNTNHDCSYFSTTLFPIWDYTLPQILELLQHMFITWGDAYFHPMSLVFLGAAFIVGLYKIQKADKMLSCIIWMLSLQCLMIFLLQFWAFADHDYYTINFYILAIFIVLLFVEQTLKNYSQFMNSGPVRIVAICFILFNIYHARQNLKDRYEGWANDFKEQIDYYDLDLFLEQHGITKHDTIISLPDKSHVSLYLMNLKGWTLYTDARFNKELPVKYNQDSLGIEHSIKNGARYLFINGFDEIKSRVYLHRFCKHLVARRNELYVFDLRSHEQNFNIPAEITLFHYLCDAERLNAGGSHFLSTADSMQFEFGNLQTQHIAKSGIFSIGLNKDKPFGMTIRIKDTQPDEFIRIEVWRYDPMSTESGIVAAIQGKNVYYNKFESIQKEGDWERLQMQFKVDSFQAGEMLEMYLFNPKQGLAYFDDLSIRRYIVK